MDIDNYSKEALNARLGASYAAFYEREDDGIITKISFRQRLNELFHLFALPTVGTSSLAIEIAQALQGREYYYFDSRNGKKIPTKNNKELGENELNKIRESLMAQHTESPSLRF